MILWLLNVPPSSCAKLSSWHEGHVIEFSRDLENSMASICILVLSRPKVSSPHPRHVPRAFMEPKGLYGLLLLAHLDLFEKPSLC